MKLSEIAKRKALWAEQKADDASESSAPWALKNLRLYQNHASRYWGEHFAALRAEEAEGRACGSSCPLPKEMGDDGPIVDLEHAHSCRCSECRAEG